MWRSLLPGLPAGGPTPGIFFKVDARAAQRFFLFLAGTSTYLRQASDGPAWPHRTLLRKLATFLLTRGLWLVLLELTVLRVAWTFNLDFAHYMLAGVIWMIGWCMVLMSGLVFLPRKAIAALGIAIIAGHNITDFFPGAMASLTTSNRRVRSRDSWEALRTLQMAARRQLTNPTVFPLSVVLYVIIPWIGVMAAGYAFGPVMQLPPERRRAVCLRLGMAMIAALLFSCRAFDVYGDPRH